MTTSIIKIMMQLLECVHGLTIYADYALSE